MRSVLLLAGLSGVLAGCGSHDSPAVDHAEYHYWMVGNHAAGTHGADCDQHGSSVTVRGRTYSAYECTINADGRWDGTRFAAYWDGKHPLGCAEMPRRAQNALCFD